MGRRDSGHDLGPDEAAVVDLIVTRGLDYGAVAGATGIAEPEVRERARRALARLGGDPGDDVTAFLLGTGARDERLRGRGRLEADPAAAGRARRIAAALDAGWEGYEMPRLPRAPRTGARGLPWAWIGAAVAALVIAAVAVVVATGGDDDPVASSAPAATLEKVELKGSGNARGTATFGAGASDRLYMELDLPRLPALPRGSVYLVWIDDGSGHGYPLPTTIDSSAGGRYHRRYTLSAALVPLFRLGRSLELLRVPARSLEGLSRAVDAADSGTRPPSRPGAVVLRGALPRRGQPSTR